MAISTAAKKATATTIPGTKIVATGGWWVVVGGGIAIALSTTPLAPVAFGIMGVALLFQIENLLKGK